jgi:uncharacterized membrane protein
MASQAQSNPTKNNNDLLRIELFIAQLLRWGVIVSFVIVAIGIGAVVVTGQTGYQQIHLDDVNRIVEYHAGNPGFSNSLTDVLSGVMTLKPYAIISLGLLTLIALPVLRVAVSVIAFALERDWLYVAITAFVFLMLMLSFAIGEAGG